MDTAHIQRRQWFTGIVVAAVISYFIAALGDDPYFFSAMFPALASLYATNFMIITIFFATVAHLSAVVTLSYSLSAAKLQPAATTITEKSDDSEDESLVLLGREKLPREEVALFCA